MIQLSGKTGRIEINLTAYGMGGDLCVLISGGDTPHLGALTAASQSMGPKTIAFDTHKEYHVTEMAADRLHRAFDGNFVVCCGIHLDNIEKREIADVMELSEKLVLELCARLKNESGN
jgi:hypothetical protein